MKKYIELFPGDVNYTGEDKLVQFQVHKPRMVLKGKHLLVVEMSFQRMFLYHLVSTFLPTLCLLIVSIITMYIDESHFEATIMVSLTSMLVMYTLFQSHTDSLPQTAYIKMIDIWFLHGLVVPFFVFILEVSTELAKAREKRNGINREIRNTNSQRNQVEEGEAKEFSILKNVSEIATQTIESKETKNNQRQNTKMINHYQPLSQRDVKMRKRFWWSKLCQKLIPCFSVLFVVGYGILAYYYYNN